MIEKTHKWNKHSSGQHKVHLLEKSLNILQIIITILSFFLQDASYKTY